MVLCFDRFRFDRADQRLEDASGVIPLNPKAFEVLSVLIERRGQLVLKDQLLDEIWADTHVADGVLKVCIAEIRRALGDSATEPRFIETVHRRGYRFVAKITAPRSFEPMPSSEARGQGQSPSLIAWPAGGLPTGRAPGGLVGRGGEIELLEERLARAVRGERQVVFVTGEAGAGKTALVEHFVTGIARDQTVAVTGSQCLEQFGSAEAYMPVLEAIGRLVREDETARPLLRRYAPTWFAQLPWLVEEEDRGRLERELLGTARERMLREMAEFVEALGAKIPIVLVLDDLHWSDPSTVDLLSLLAGRRDPARLLVLGTYRPAQLVLARHPLRAVSQRLAANRQCTEVTLDDLGVEAVAEYLERRFAGSRFPFDVARLIRERTDGNPLFLVTLVDHLLARGTIVEHDRQWHAAKELRGELATVPESLRRLIEQQLERLRPEDRELLEAASLVGFEFSAAAAAAGANRDTAEAEEHLERLAGGGPFLRSAGGTAWPDGTVAGSFAFRHPLYREALAAAAPARRRAASHLRIGSVLERAYGERSSELGAELALHFEEGGDRARAVHYRRLAAQTAIGRHALAEAQTHLEAALALLAGLPASSERDREELSLQSMVGPVRMATRGYAAPETERAFTRARVLCDALPVTPELYPVLRGLISYHQVRAQLGQALALGEQLLRHAALRQEDRPLRVQAHYGHGATLFHIGALDAARTHFEAALADYDPATHRQHILVYGGYDPGVACALWLAWVRALQGEMDDAAIRNSDGLALARHHAELFSLAWAYYGTSVSQQIFRDWPASEDAAAEAARLAEEHGFPYVLGMAMINRGWALMMQGKTAAGVPMLRDGVARVDRTGAALVRPSYLGMLAAADAMEGNRKSAIARFDEALGELERTGERLHEPGLLIGKGHLLAAGGHRGRSSRPSDNAAEACLRRALDVAHAQGARLLELRAAVALSRHYAERGRMKEARALLSTAHAWFADRRPTVPEIVAARHLLAELAE
jgi:DNA-binding winged helix-turn-helix (wHTH) protein/tetratricopeptide (TPR) repeat protein